MRLIEWISFYLASLIKKPFKIGMISYYYPYNSNVFNNGVAIHSYYLSRELAKLGCDVHVFTKGDSIINPTEYLGNGRVVIHPINVDFNNNIEDAVAAKRMKYFMFDNKVITGISRENARRRFDIIHTHGWLTAGAFVSKFLGNIKWAHTFHAVEKNRLKFMSEDDKKYFALAEWVESTIKHADALISVSQALQDEVAQSYSLENQKNFYVPNGVDADLFRPSPSPANMNEKGILCVGRFSLEKGIDFVPRIAESVLRHRPDTKFTVVAAEEKLPSLEKVKIAMNTLEDSYPGRFLWIKQKLGREEMAKLYNQSAIYIQPSRYESFGLCVLEAMACGKPVVCSNTGGLPEVVGDAGLISQPDGKAFVRNILTLLDNPETYNKYAKAAVKRASQFTWPKIASDMLFLYKKISSSDLQSK
jgi:glycosyltransferase involved in cell wall biosynthesis